MNGPMTDEQLDAIKARIGALNKHATEGDWRYEGSDQVLVLPAEGGHVELVASVWGEAGSAEERALGEFVAHSRNDVPALVAEVDRLAAHRAELVAQVNELRSGIEAALERIDAHDHGDAPYSEHWKWAEVRQALTGGAADA